VISPARAIAATARNIAILLNMRNGMLIGRGFADDALTDGGAEGGSATHVWWHVE